MADKLKLKPLADRVLLQEVEEDEEEQGGIVLPEEARSDQNLLRAEVIAVGTDQDEIEVSEGDTVLIDSFAGRKFEADGADYRIVKAEDILAIAE
jgi:chaperonin GroES